jgi:hypothetical protein
MVRALCDFGSFVVQLRLKSLVLAVESYIEPGLRPPSPENGNCFNEPPETPLVRFSAIISGQFPDRQLPGWSQRIRT